MLNWDEETTPAASGAPGIALPPGGTMLGTSPFLAPRAPENAAATFAAPRPQAPAQKVSERRVNAADKRIINGQTDVNQLVPFKYKWAWEKYLATCANHWMPQEVNMTRDIALWKDPHGLSEDERRIVSSSLSTF